MQGVQKVVERDGQQIDNTYNIKGDFSGKLASYCNVKNDYCLYCYYNADVKVIVKCL